MSLAPLTIRQHMRDYLAMREVSRSYADTIKIAVGHFEVFLGRGATLDDLTAPTINRFISYLLDRELSRWTVNNYRNAVVRLWRDAYEAHLTEAIPSRIRKVKIPRMAVRAWTPEQVQRLLEAADKVPGRFRKVRLRRCLFWRAFVLTAWDSALRLGDLWTLQSDVVRFKDRFTITQRKTGQPIVCRLRPETIEAIRATFPPMRELVFGSVLSQKKIYKQFRKLTDSARLFTDGGLTRMLRKSSATAVEKATPGASMRHLGHTSAGVAWRHYLDQEQIDQAKPLVPGLGAASEKAAGQQSTVTMMATSATSAPTTADMEAMLRRLLADARAIQAATSTPVAGAPALPMLELLDEFLSSPELAATSTEYRQNVHCSVRAAIEDCGFATSDELNGERLTGWLRGRLEGGLSAARVSWCRYALIRFLKWASRRGAGPSVFECLGALSAASDLNQPKTATERAAAKVKKRREARARKRADGATYGVATGEAARDDDNQRTGTADHAATIN